MDAKLIDDALHNDALARAKVNLSAALPCIDPSNAGERLALAQSAATIALVERQDAENEHLAHIRDSLDDLSVALASIAAVLQNAEGAAPGSDPADTASAHHTN